jgi:hypothetical protein
LSIGDDGVNGGKREVLLLRHELSKKVGIVDMHGPQEEHDLEDGRNGHRQPRQSPKVALKPGAKLVDALLFALSVVVEGQKIVPMGYTAPVLGLRTAAISL